MPAAKANPKSWHDIARSDLILPEVSGTGQPSSRGEQGAEEGSLSQRNVTTSPVGLYWDYIIPQEWRIKRKFTWRMKWKRGFAACMAIQQRKVPSRYSSQRITPHQDTNSKPTILTPHHTQRSQREAFSGLGINCKLRYLPGHRNYPHTHKQKPKPHNRIHQHHDRKQERLQLDYSLANSTAYLNFASQFTFIRMKCINFLLLPDSQAIVHLPPRSTQS